jgi:hypothetical protein
MLTTKTTNHVASRPRAVQARARSEDGQAVVEFALVLFPFLLLVAGLIQLGIGISFWQDQQRLAAAGARVAIVNCAAASWCTPTLEQYLEQQPLANGNRPDATVCFTSKSGQGGTAVVGDSVTVLLEAPFRLVPIIGVGTITLSARTTMRMEQNATNAGIALEPVCT